MNYFTHTHFALAGESIQLKDCTFNSVFKTLSIIMYYIIRVDIMEEEAHHLISLVPVVETWDQLLFSELDGTETKIF